MSAGETGPTLTDSPRSDATFLAGLPSGAEVIEAAFSEERRPDQTVLLEFPRSFQRHAVRIGRAPDQSAPLPDDHLLILTVPTSDLQNSELLERVARWTDIEASPLKTCQLMTLQGALIAWNERRYAVLGTAERLETLRAAVIEAAFDDMELREIERSLAESWPQWEADLPLAFDFHQRAMPKRKALLQRFQQSLRLRARLARIAPRVHPPHIHPPTLASQVGERLRERNQMAHRHEFLSEQVEVFERVYELCGQRASDHQLTRSGNMLEWVIIVLLVTQTLFSALDLLTSSSAGASTSASPNAATSTVN